MDTFIPNRKTASVRLTHYQGEQCLMVSTYDDIIAIFKKDKEMVDYKGGRYDYQNLLEELKNEGYIITF